MSNYSSRTADKFVVRLPDGLREQIAVVAKENHRSMNSQIISVLERGLGLDPSENLAPAEGVLVAGGWTPVKGMYVRTPDGVGEIQYLSFPDEETIHVVVGGTHWLPKFLTPVVF